MPLSPLRSLGLAAVATVALAGCNQPRELIVDEAVIKLSPVLQNPAAMYFRVRGGEKPTELVAILAPSTIRTEIHETVKDPKTGAMTMNRINSVPIPARGEVKFQRGGKHVMLWGVNLVARRLQEAEVTFVFSNGDRILVTVPVEGVGDEVK